MLINTHESRFKHEYKRLIQSIVIISYYYIITVHIIIIINSFFTITSLLSKIHEASQDINGLKRTNHKHTIISVQS